MLTDYVAYSRSGDGLSLTALNLSSTLRHHFTSSGRGFAFTPKAFGNLARGSYPGNTSEIRLLTLKGFD